MIRLIEDFYIKLDGHQYVLVRNKAGKTKEGEPTVTTTVYGYFGSLCHCLRQCREVLFSERIGDAVVTLNEAIQTLKDLNYEIETLFETEDDL